MLRTIGRAALAAVSAFALLPALASANGTSVSPTRLLLATGAASTYVTITNTSSAPQRYSASAYRWGQTPANPDVLSPTSDIVFFPGSFTIASLQSQRIRIGSTAASDAAEKTYRLIVSELPPLQSIVSPGTTGLAFTASFSIPIYLAPQRAEPSGEITDVVVDRHNLRFTVRNSGNVHFVGKSMRVVARGDAAAIMSAESSAWSVLAGSRHEFVMPIPGGTCTSIRSVSITVDADTTKFDRTALPEHVCG